MSMTSAALQCGESEAISARLARWGAACTRGHVDRGVRYIQMHVELEQYIEVYRDKYALGKVSLHPAADLWFLQCH